MGPEGGSGGAWSSPRAPPSTSRGAASHTGRFLKPSSSGPRARTRRRGTTRTVPRGREPGGLPATAAEHNEVPHSEVDGGWTRTRKLHHGRCEEDHVEHDRQQDTVLHHDPEEERMSEARPTRVGTRTPRGGSATSPDRRGVLKRSSVRGRRRGAGPPCSRPKRQTRRGRGLAGGRPAATPTSEIPVGGGKVFAQPDLVTQPRPAPSRRSTRCAPTRAAPSGRRGRADLLPCPEPLRRRHGRPSSRVRRRRPHGQEDHGDGGSFSVS